jgi:hypothetical protein
MSDEQSGCIERMIRNQQRQGLLGWANLQHRYRMLHRREAARPPASTALHMQPVYFDLSRMDGPAPDIDRNAVGDENEDDDQYDDLPTLISTSPSYNLDDLSILDGPTTYSAPIFDTDNHVDVDPAYPYVDLPPLVSTSPPSDCDKICG